MPERSAPTFRTSGQPPEEAQAAGHRQEQAGTALQASEERFGLFIQSVQDKSAFMATMSHELRTPRNAMLGYTELLLGGCRSRFPTRRAGTWGDCA